MLQPLDCPKERPGRLVTACVTAAEPRPSWALSEVRTRQCLARKTKLFVLTPEWMVPCTTYGGEFTQGIDFQVIAALPWSRSPDPWHVSARQVRLFANGLSVARNRFHLSSRSGSVRKASHG
jgi:hypothetical protein